MEEIYKDIVDYEGLYQISNLGNVRSLDKEINLPKGKYIKKGRRISTTRIGNYITFCGYKNGGQKNLYVHREIARAFINNPDNLPAVNHLDGNKKNNSISNLEWCSYMRNIRHAYETGLMNKSKGENHCHAKLKAEDISKIKELVMDNTFQKVADMYGVTRQAIWLIYKGKNWK